MKHWLNGLVLVVALGLLCAAATAQNDTTNGKGKADNDQPKKAAAKPAAHHEEKPAVKSEKRSADDVFKSMEKEEVKHRHREARLDRLHDVYKQKGNHAGVTRVAALKAKEQKRYAHKMEVLKKESPAASRKFDAAMKHVGQREAGKTHAMKEGAKKDAAKTAPAKHDAKADPKDKGSK